MKFSIRDLFLVTVGVALTVGWLIDHQRQAAKADGLVDRLNETDGGLVMLRTILESHGYKVHWEPVAGQMRVEPDLPLSSAPAPIPPKN